jgi:hypothetical protein
LRFVRVLRDVKVDASVSQFGRKLRRRSLAPVGSLESLLPPARIGGARVEEFGCAHMLSSVRTRPRRPGRARGAAVTSSMSAATRPPIMSRARSIMVMPPLRSTVDTAHYSRRE